MPLTLAIVFWMPSDDTEFNTCFTLSGCLRAFLISPSILEPLTLWDSVPAEIQLLTTLIKTHPGFTFGEGTFSPITFPFFIIPWIFTYP